MRFKEIFLENKDRRYCNITKVKKENMTLVIDPIRKIKENWIVLLGILVVIIGFLLINFNSKIFLVSLALIAFLVVVYIFGNKAILKCDKDLLYIKQGFQENKIPYSKIKTVFISRAAELMLFIPTYSYNIIIRYEDNFSFIRELNFSLMCADEDEVKEFIENFEIENKINQRIVKFEKRKFIGKLLTFIITIIAVVFIFMYVYRYINFDNLI
jgi:hypothetical protein